MPGFSWFGKNIGIKDDTFDFGGIFSDVMEIFLGKGAYTETVWGCDLTEEYVKVNAYYTT